MADTDLQRLVVSLEARLDKYTRAMEKAAGDTDRQLGRVENRFKQAESQIATFGKGVFEGFIAGFSVAAFRGMISSIAGIADEAKRAGVSAEGLQKAIFAARQEGGNAASIVQAFGKLNLELGQAAQKGNDLGKILTANNISIAELQGDPVRALLKIADLMRNAATAQDRAVIGTAAFGRGYQELLPFLSQGGEAIKAQMDRFEEMGGVIDSKVISQVKELDDKLTAIGDVAVANIHKALGDLVRDFEQMVGLADRLFSSLGGSAGGVAGKVNDVLSMSPQELAEWIARQFGVTPHIQGPGPSWERTGRGPRPTAETTVVPVEATPEQKKAAADAEREARKQAEAITKVIDSLELQRANLSRTDREQAIYNELAKAGIDINTESGQRIAALTGNLYDQKQAMADLVGSLDEARDATKAFFGDLLSGLREGKSLTEVLGTAFEHLADRLANRLLDQAIDALFGKAGTGLPAWLQAATAPGVPGTQTAAGGASAGVSAATKLLPTGPTAPTEPVTERVLPALTGLPGAITRAPYDTTGEVTVNRAGKADFGAFPIMEGGAPARQVAPTVIQPVSSTANPFLDLLGRTEGTDRGAGYNASLGYGRFLPGGREQNLTGMNLDQIRELQTQILKNPENTLNSSAIGRYQITRSTLDDLRSQLDLKGNELFDPAMQDRLAMTRAQWDPSASGLKSAWPSLNSMPDANVLQTYADQAQQGAKVMATAVQDIGSTAASTATGFAGSFTPAIDSLLQTITSFVGGAGGGGAGGLFGSIFGAGGGARAEGGPVERGRPYLVGERGREIFVPGEPGRILPAHETERVVRSEREWRNLIERSRIEIRSEHTAEPRHRASGGPVNPLANVVLADLREGQRVGVADRPPIVLRAEGGPIVGPGSSHSDSIPAMLSNGEFVINAEAAARHRSVLEAINSGRHLADGSIVGADRMPRLEMPHIPDAAKPAAATAPANTRFGLEVVPSKYFDVRVRQISGQGDARVLDAARKSYPETASRYSKLGTTSR